MQKASPPPLVQVQVSIDNPAIAAIADRLRETVQTAIANELAKLGDTIRPVVIEQPPARPEPTAAAGVKLPNEERVKAADLRTALLLGKVPENSGILIDGKALAKLLNVSYRTLYRLIDEKAIPEPVLLGGKLRKWRLTEVLEWVDSDCPPQKLWDYSTDRLPPKKKGR